MLSGHYLSAVITASYCKSSLCSFDVCRTAPIRHVLSDQASQLGQRVPV